jgi:hypothetical protein
MEMGMGMPERAAATRRSAQGVYARSHCVNASAQGRQIRAVVQPVRAAPALHSSRAMACLRPLFRLAAPALFGLFALSTVACNRVRVDDVRGPDNTDWKRISCRRMDKKCYRAAARLCPNGYYFAKATGPVRASTTYVDEDGTVIGTSNQPAPHPRAGVNAKTLPPQERWGDGMYSRNGGTIIVQCAEITASR